MVRTCNELNAGYAAGESGLKAWYSCMPIYDVRVGPNQGEAVRVQLFR